MVAEVYFNVPDNIPRDLFGEVLEKVKKTEPKKQKLVDRRPWQYCFTPGLKRGNL